MQDAYGEVLSYVEHIASDLAEATSSATRRGSREPRTTSPPEPSETSSSSNDSSSKTGDTGSGLLWWLTSLLFGVSSAVAYHWVAQEVRRSRLHLQDSNAQPNLQVWAKTQAKRLAKWARRSIRKFEGDLSQTDLSLECALGTSLFLPDQITVPWVLGCLMVSKSLSVTQRAGGNQAADSGMEKYPPYLFLCFCPGRYRLHLWLAWAGLQVLGNSRDNASGKAFGDRPKSSDERRSGGLALNSEEAYSAPTRTVKESSKVPTRYLEIMIHNVSHTDVILSLDPPDASTEPDFKSNESRYCLCRPRFSFMDVYCRVVLDALTGKETIMEFPRYQRSDDDPRYLIKDEPAGSTPAGLALNSDSTLVADLSEVRVRGRDLVKFGSENETSPWPSSPSKERESAKFPISHVFFPLLATLLPHWRAQIEERKYPRDVKRVLILVTGVGTPRNWTHSVSGNSTLKCAQLMEHFLKRIDPELTVVRIHSQTNIFRYDENLRFVDREFAPVMNAWRDAHARNLPYPDQPNSSSDTLMANNPFNADWRNSMSVTLSAADGSTARTHAIRESLRPFRPTYFHFWQLKTFWHETKIVDDDLEVHSYETMETQPAVDAERLRDEDVQLVVNEMKAFREETLEIIKQGQHDIAKFWLRKTHKPVLAVLLVQSPGMRRPVVYRGTNMEVSMPTGSLCAERNVIGTALASNPQLKREDLKMIAVLAIPTLDEIAENPLGRVDSTASIGSTTVDSNLDKPVDHRLSVGSEADDWVLPTEQQNNHPQGLDQSFALVTPASDENQPVPQTNVDSTPVRKIRLYSKSAGRQKHKKSIFVQNSHDLNPLKPCGACNEWLKKIAECNPYFKIVTFTDGDCHGVYCQPCQQ